VAQLLMACQTIYKVEFLKPESARFLRSTGFLLFFQKCKYILLNALKCVQKALTFSVCSCVDLFSSTWAGKMAVLVKACKNAEKWKFANSKKSQDFLNISDLQNSTYSNVMKHAKSLDF
jgi:hypothetical protein